MLIDALRGYLQLANGLTEVTRQRAMAAAKALLSQTGASVEQAVPEQIHKQIQGLAEELVATSRSNRHLLLTLVLGEVERAVVRLGLVTGEELTRTNQTVELLARRVTALEDARVAASPVPASASASAPASTPVPAQADGLATAPAAVLARKAALKSKTTVVNNAPVERAPAETPVKEVVKEVEVATGQTDAQAPAPATAVKKTTRSTKTTAAKKPAVPKAATTKRTATKRTAAAKTATAKRTATAKTAKEAPQKEAGRKAPAKTAAKKPTKRAPAKQKTAPQKAAQEKAAQEKAEPTAANTPPTAPAAGPAAPPPSSEADS